MYLVGNELVEKVALRTLPVEIMRHDALHKARVVVPEAAHRNEDGNRDRDGQAHGKRERESLDAYLAREFRCRKQ